MKAGPWQLGRGRRSRPLRLNVSGSFSASSCRIEHRTNDFVQHQVAAPAGPQGPLLEILKRRKLAWLGHTIDHDTLSKTTLQGTLEGGRRRGRQRKRWIENIKVNIKEWPTILGMSAQLQEAQNKPSWRTLSAASSLVSSLPDDRLGQGTECVTCAQIWVRPVHTKGGSDKTQVCTSVDPKGRKNWSLTLPHQGIEPRVFRCEFRRSNH